MRFEEYTVTDWNRNARTITDFAEAMRHAIKVTDTEQMTKITMPDGSEYTILQRPKTTKLTGS